MAVVEPQVVAQEARKEVAAVGGWQRRTSATILPSLSTLGWQRRGRGQRQGGVGQKQLLGLP